MNKDIKLDRKAMTSIVENLMKGGFINKSLRDEGALDGGGRLAVDWTRKGTRMIISYAEAFYSIGSPSTRKVNAFNALLVRSALNLAR
jgi:hypothetical protein